MSKVKHIPQTLVYEMVDGDPIYYRGYEEVLRGEKKREEIMGSSVLQGRIVAKLILWLGRYLDLAKYEVITSEVGLQLGKGSWRNLDLAIVEKSRIQGDIDSTEYLKVPPKVVIEVDIKAHFEDLSQPMGYWEQKVDQLLDFGVEKVIWVFTDSKRILIAEKDQDWILCNWDKEVAVLDEVVVRVDELLE